MKKKATLNLRQLRVKSFVTSLKESETATMKGGTEVTCVTDAPNCPLTFPVAGCGAPTFNANCATERTQCC